MDRVFIGGSNVVDLSCSHLLFQKQSAEREINPKANDDSFAKFQVRMRRACGIPPSSFLSLALAFALARSTERNWIDIAVSRLQVTSHPVQRNFARLKITEAYSIIPGAPDLHVKQGSSLRLECQLMAATEKPLYVFWYRQDRMINYEEPGVDVKLTLNGSILTVNKTKLTHDGNYTCTPSNAKPASIMVHVIEGEKRVVTLCSIHLSLSRNARRKNSDGADVIR
jgi:hypothetical protein